MRVSGKHNDLENVGPSPRHHTFFEMLGNFSFGDYFKRDAIRYAYVLLTEVYGLPPERLAFTVYYKDDEAYDLWVREMGVDPRRVARLGEKTNFWQMAETGPCGPTSELHWDKYPERGVDTIIESLENDDDRFLELWNLVFMQYNRTQPDEDHTGRYDVPLPAPGVDTGMGLERILSVVNEVDANYETDLFMPIIRAVQALTGHTDQERDANIVPYRVIADHMRAAVFLIADGVLPGAKGRDSVCRLVIRRAARFGAKLGFEKPFLAQIATAVIDVMGGHYTDLVEQSERIRQVITLEEERFRRTMERGLAELDTMLDQLATHGSHVLSGDNAFYLKATLGLPIQVTKDIAEERGFQVDMAGFQAAEDAHALASGGDKPMGVMETAEQYSALLERLIREGSLGSDGVHYDPYSTVHVEDRVVALLVDGQPVESAIVGDKVEVILGSTCFYVESGGQVSDTGVIRGDGWVIDVEAMAKPVSGLIVHIGEVLEGTPHVHEAASALVDVERRTSITRNHTATHLLHAALRNRLGAHVQQRGSLVAPDRLRFDFAHDGRIDENTLRAIEDEINGIIMANYTVVAQEKSLNQAREEGAMALFGEKYGDRVRTISIIGQDGSRRYSYELCGGVHVPETGRIGSFQIVGESSVSAGVRRIEALTGAGSASQSQRNAMLLSALADQLGTTTDRLTSRLDALQGELASSRKMIEKLQRQLARQQFEALLNGVEQINGISALIGRVDNASQESLREMADWFRNAVPSGVLVLASVVDDKPQLCVAVTDDLSKRYHAGTIIKQLAAVVGGGGGGRPNLALAGGKDASRIGEALAQAHQLLANGAH
jgi:alanyl-tRNA synthetase